MSLLLDVSTLRNCRRVYLRQIEARTHVGVHDEEKLARQRLLISVELYVPLALCTPMRDCVEEVLDYNFIREAVMDRMGRGHTHLLETLADDLLRTMLAHPMVKAAVVTVEKPDVFADCVGVGIEVAGHRSDHD